MDFRNPTRRVLTQKLDSVQKRDEYLQRGLTSDFADTLRSADSTSDPPRLAVLEAVHANPHADTDTVSLRSEPLYRTFPGRRCTTCTHDRGESCTQDPAVRFSGPVRGAGG